jgi:hypothetical protein
MTCVHDCKNFEPKTAATPESSDKKDVRIVVLQRGWILVGYFGKKGLGCWLKNSKCIRRWGTTTGLGQLVNGPTPETKLDENGDASFHRMTVVFDIRCNAEKWASILG